MIEQNKKDNRGYLYPNKNKNKPTQPDYTGKVIVNSKELKISAWENQTPEGNKYLSIAFSEPPANTNPNLGENKATEQTSSSDNQEKKNQNTITDDLDLDAILNSTDDDSPF